MTSSDFCIPEKECTTFGEENPCELFKKMKFPVNEFFPPTLSNLTFADDFADNNTKNYSNNRTDNDRNDRNFSKTR